MINQISNLERLLLVFLIIVFALFTLVIFRVLIIKNRKIKKINIYSSENSKYHQDRLFELIKIDTPSFSEGDGYFHFKEKIEEQFPLVHKLLTKEKVDGNAIYTYKADTLNAPNILLASHIDYSGKPREAYINGDNIYGNGTFDSKSLLYVIFEAVESILNENKKLDVDLTIVITNDDEAKKDGLTKIINLFLKRGNFFNIVIEEGSGIIDPEVYGLKSNYALVGLGVSGQVQLRFESKDENKLIKFISEVTKPNFFKMKIDNKTIKVLGSIAKDLKFGDRFFLNNIWLFKSKAKKIIEEKYNGIEKMLKTNVSTSKVLKNNDLHYVDMVFELSTHEKAADILMHIDDLMEKYNIDYKIQKVIESSSVTKTYTYGYNLVKSAINNVFNDVYIAPVIVTKISEKRYFDKVSDCVIRFSPLYYNIEAYNSSITDGSYINANILDNGIKFFKYILENTNKK